MIAESLTSVTDNRTVKPVLPSMRSIDEDAEYYSLLDEHVCLYILTDEKIGDVEDKDWKYLIGDEKIYRSIGTNKIEVFLNKENAE